MVNVHTGKVKDTLEIVRCITCNCNILIFNCRVEKDGVKVWEAAITVLPDSNIPTGNHSAGAVCYHSHH